MTGIYGPQVGVGEGRPECPYATLAVGEIERLFADGEGLGLAIHRTTRQIVETMQDDERGVDFNVYEGQMPDQVAHPVVDLVMQRTEQMGELTRVDGTSFALIEGLDTCRTCDDFGTPDFVVCEFAASAVTSLVTRRFYGQ